MYFIPMFDLPTIRDNCLQPSAAVPIPIPRPLTHSLGEKARKTFRVQTEPFIRLPPKNVKGTTQPTLHSTNLDPADAIERHRCSSVTATLTSTHFVIHSCRGLLRSFFRESCRQANLSLYLCRRSFSFSVLRLFSIPCRLILTLLLHLPRDSCHLFPRNAFWRVVPIPNPVDFTATREDEGVEQGRKCCSDISLLADRWATTRGRRRNGERKKRHDKTDDSSGHPPPKINYSPSFFHVLPPQSRFVIDLNTQTSPPTTTNNNNSPSRPAIE